MGEKNKLSSNITKDWGRRGGCRSFLKEATCKVGFKDEEGSHRDVGVGVDLCKMLSFSFLNSWNLISRPPIKRERETLTLSLHYNRKSDVHITVRKCYSSRYFWMADWFSFRGGCRSSCRNLATKPGMKTIHISHFPLLVHHLWSITGHRKVRGESRAGGQTMESDPQLCS